MKWYANAAIVGSSVTHLKPRKRHGEYFTVVVVLLIVRSGWHEDTRTPDIRITIRRLSTGSTNFGMLMPLLEGNRVGLWACSTDRGKTLSPDWYHVIATINHKSMMLVFPRDTKNGAAYAIEAQCTVSSSRRLLDVPINFDNADMEEFKTDHQRDEQLIVSLTLNWLSNAVILNVKKTLR